MPVDDGGWGTSSGLYTDFEGEIVESHFGVDARYNNGETTLLFLKIKPEGNISVTTEDGLIEVNFACGSGWFSYDGGETIEHSDGKAKINGSAVYGKVIDWALENGLGDDLRAKGSPLEAKVWVGLRLRFEEVGINYGGDIGTKKKVMPVEVLSGAGSGTTGATGTSSDSKDSLEGFGDELTVLAENSPTAEAFTESAMGLTGITDHANLVVQIADGTLYDKLKG